MGWFSNNNTSSKQSKLESTQIEQRSHQPINATSDISSTLEQITNFQAPKIKTPTEDPKTSIVNFVKENDKKMFIIDGEKDVKESIICTDNANGGKTCLKLSVSSIELFKTMQKMDYFCSLPDDMNATYFECRKIN